MWLHEFHLKTINSPAKSKYATREFVRSASNQNCRVCKTTRVGNKIAHPTLREKKRKNHSVSTCDPQIHVEHGTQIAGIALNTREKRHAENNDHENDDNTIRVEIHTQQASTIEPSGTYENMVKGEKNSMETIYEYASTQHCCSWKKKTPMNMKQRHTCEATLCSLWPARKKLDVSAVDW